MEKSAADMTVEEFAAHIKMMHDRVVNFKNYGGSVVGKRQDRSYANQKRGNFQGNLQKSAREQLKELSISVKANGNLKRGKYDG